MIDAGFKPLKLLAIQPLDLEVLSSYLQDGLLSVSSLDYDSKNGRFSCLVNRFCWETIDHKKDQNSYYRVHTGLCFSEVLEVHLRGFHQSSSRRILNILSLTMPSKNHVHFLFSDDHEIRIKIQDLYCQFADLDHPWPTSKKPTHLHQHLEDLTNKIL